ncbi:glucan biosynthesis protein [Bradyrhizobium guangdongense]|uniref:glucan biosynthesis protein n=1 Tax=Bradyrhizobium guangdongense TaxID=1325090 RepID=UPI0032DF4C28
MNRRQLVRGSAALPALLLASRTGFAAAGPTEGTFAPSTVRDLARMLAGKPYEAPDEKLPGGLKDLDYDRYRSIRFLPERALWRGKNLPFEAQFFHRGFFYKNRVNLFQVADGKATEIKYRKADFSFGEKVPAFEETDLGLIWPWSQREDSIGCRACISWWASVPI